MRADKALVEYKIFPTRAKAQQAIESGIVAYEDKIITKSSLEISDPTLLTLQGEKMPFVSRGGLKLEKALTLFKINLTGKIVLDIGSSTGGFSDCALQHGAQHIIAVDTGTNQMDSILRQDKRISLFEQTDFRTLAAKHLDKVQLATIDISFLSVTKILDKLITIPNLDEIICLIKPQFECGKEIANKYKGVIKNPTIHQTILKDVITAFEQHHFNIKNLTFSPITGVSGNIEYLGYFTKLPPVLVDINAIVHDAFNTL